MVWTNIWRVPTTHNWRVDLPLPAGAGGRLSSLRPPQLSLSRVINVAYHEVVKPKAGLDNGRAVHGPRTQQDKGDAFFGAFGNIP